MGTPYEYFLNNQKLNKKVSYNSEFVEALIEEIKTLAFEEGLAAGQESSYQQGYNAGFIAGKDS